MIDFSLGASSNMYLDVKFLVIARGSRRTRQRPTIGGGRLVRPAPSKELTTRLGYHTNCVGITSTDFK